jgi:hypothetical protein
MYMQTTASVAALRGVPPGPSSWPFLGNLPDLRAAGDMSRFDVEVLPCTDVKPVAIAMMRPSGPVRVVLRRRAAARANPETHFAKGSRHVAQ